MRRDMDLIRALLLKLEALSVKPGQTATIEPGDPRVAVEGYSDDEIDQHLDWIKERGLISEVGFNPLVGMSFTRLSWGEPTFWTPSETRKYGVRQSGPLTALVAFHSNS